MRDLHRVFTCGQNIAQCVIYIAFVLVAKILRRTLFRTKLRQKFQDRKPSRQSACTDNTPNHDTHSASFLSCSFLYLLVSLSVPLFSPFYFPRLLLQYSVRRSVRHYSTVQAASMSKHQIVSFGGPLYKKKDTSQGYTNPRRQFAPSTGNQIMTGGA